VSRLQEISKKDYIPDIEDILRCRNKTTGIITEKFNMTKNMDLLFVFKY
jgi:hypothetical protein